MTHLTSKTAASVEHSIRRNCDTLTARARDQAAIGRLATGLLFAVGTGMLMLDRYLVAGGRALDLATGASIRWHVRRQRVVAVAAALHRARPVLVDRLRPARPNADRSMGAPPGWPARGQRRDVVRLSRRVGRRSRWPAARARSHGAVDGAVALSCSASSRARRGSPASCRWRPTRSAPCCRRRVGDGRPGSGIGRSSSSPPTRGSRPTRCSRCSSSPRKTPGRTSSFAASRASCGGRGSSRRRCTFTRARRPSASSRLSR